MLSQLLEYSNWDVLKLNINIRKQEWPTRFEYSDKTDLRWTEEGGRFYERKIVVIMSEWNPKREKRKKMKYWKTGEMGAQKEGRL